MAGIEAINALPLVSSDLTLAIAEFLMCHQL